MERLYKKIQWRSHIAPDVTPKKEAEALLGMVGRNGETVQSIRNLIGVPKHYKNYLVTNSPRKEHLRLEKSFCYRRAVLAEFDLLWAEAGLGVVAG